MHTKWSFIFTVRARLIPSVAQWSLSEQLRLARVRQAGGGGGISGDGVVLTVALNAQD